MDLLLLQVGLDDPDASWVQTLPEDTFGLLPILHNNMILISCQGYLIIINITTFIVNHLTQYILTGINKKKNK